MNFIFRNIQDYNSSGECTEMFIGGKFKDNRVVVFGDLSSYIIQGVDGKSAYELWLAAGNTGSMHTFLASLRGPQGPMGQGVVIKGSDTEANIRAKTGTSGDMWIIKEAGNANDRHGLAWDGSGWIDVGTIQGPKGDKGDTGKSAYEEWLANGHTGNVNAFLTDIKGEKGDKGDVGPQGLKGDVGPQGIQGIQGQKGDKGDTGPKGDDGKDGAVGPKGDKGDRGTSIHFKHAYNTLADLKAANPTPEIGETHLVLYADDGTTPLGDLFVYDNPTPPHDPANADWHNVGHVQGPQGLKGPKGDKGDKGDSITGPQGPAGPTGPQGIPGKTGPAGPQGPKGEKGDKGDTGPMGPAGTIDSDSAYIKIEKTTGNPTIVRQKPTDWINSITKISNNRVQIDFTNDFSNPNYFVNVTGGVNFRSWKTHPVDAITESHIIINVDNDVSHDEYFYLEIQA